MHLSYYYNAIQWRAGHITVQPKLRTKRRAWPHQAASYRRQVYTMIMLKLFLFFLFFLNPLSYWSPDFTPSLHWRDQCLISDALDAVWKRDRAFLTHGQVRTLVNWRGTDAPKTQSRPLAATSKAMIFSSLLSRSHTLVRQLALVGTNVPSTHPHGQPGRTPAKACQYELKWVAATPDPGPCTCEWLIPISITRSVHGRHRHVSNLRQLSKTGCL